MIIAGTHKGIPARLNKMRRPQKRRFAQKNAAAVPIRHASAAEKTACPAVNINMAKMCRMSAALDALFAAKCPPNKGANAAAAGTKKNKTAAANAAPKNESAAVVPIRFSLSVLKNIRSLNRHTLTYKQTYLETKLSNRSHFQFYKVRRTPQILSDA